MIKMDNWWEAPNVVWWDWKERPDWEEVNDILKPLGVIIEEIDTGTDDYAVRITPYLEDNSDTN